MKIVRISVWQKTLPLAQPYWLSGGRLKFESLDSTILRIDTDAGLSGWGEGCPWGESYLPAHGPGIRAALPLLARAVLGRDPLGIEKVNRAMDTALPGHLYAKSPIDIALWDLKGRYTNTPLYTLLGGSEGETVPVNSSISTGTPEEMAALIETYRGRGYTTHSAKVGSDDPDLDIARIEALEAIRQPGEFITYDVNRAWTPGVALEVMNAVSARGWFEQPCETLDQCQTVNHGTRQPIMLDECLHDFQDHLAAWRGNAGAGCKVKPNRVGGLTKAKKIRDFGLAVGWRMHIEDTGGTVIADTAALHLALSTPQENRLASWLCHPHVVAEIDPCPSDVGARNRHGVVQLSNAPGLGLTPSEEYLGDPVAVYE